MVLEPQRPRQYRIPGHDPNPKTPVDNWSSHDWLEDGIWGMEGASDDEDDSHVPPVSFRIPAKLHRLASQIREDPNSPYFNLFKAKTDLWRHLITKGLIALGESYVLTRGMAQSMALNESVLANTMAMKSTREQMNKTVEMTIRAALAEFEQGNSVEAAATLDSFFDGVLEWEDTRRKNYVLALINHPAFKKLRGDSLMLECSKYLKDFIAKYQEVPNVPEV